MTSIFSDLNKVIMANDLINGEVVFLTDKLEWASQIEQAWISDSQASIEMHMEQAKKSHLIIDPYPVEVRTNDDGFFVNGYREYLRTRGPSVRMDLGKQAA